MRLGRLAMPPGFAMEGPFVYQLGESEEQNMDDLDDEWLPGGDGSVGCPVCGAAWVACRGGGIVDGEERALFECSHGHWASWGRSSRQLRSEEYHRLRCWPCSWTQ